MKYICLFSALFFAIALLGCDASSTQTDTFEESFSPVEKNPALPATFMDTTGTKYAWTNHYHAVHTIANRIHTPAGFKRTKVGEDSFGDWLRYLPVFPGKPDVLLYNGQLKGNQRAHHLVLDIDVGERDLQQCADAVMRLRAEYLWSAKKFEAIHFNFTSGHTSKWLDWKAGKRPVVKGNQVSFVQKAAADGSYTNFKRYMTDIFNWAGTSSLSKELKKVEMKDMQIGDVFIQGGFPGHAVTVVDMAENAATGEKLFLIAQSYMPAQQIHVLRNPSDERLSPWYKIKTSGNIETPEWTFTTNDLHRFE